MTEPRAAGPASESRQGTNPRAMVRGGCRALRYGDLAEAEGANEGAQCASGRAMTRRLGSTAGGELGCLSPNCSNIATAVLTCAISSSSSWFENDGSNTANALATFAPIRGRPPTARDHVRGLTCSKSPRNSFSFEISVRCSDVSCSREFCSSSGEFYAFSSSSPNDRT